MYYTYLVYRSIVAAAVVAAAGWSRHAGNDNHTIPTDKELPKPARFPIWRHRRASACPCPCSRRLLLLRRRCALVHLLNIGEHEVEVAIEAEEHSC